MQTEVKNATVVHEGSQIILPIINGKPMSYKEGVEWLQRREKEDEQEFAVYHVIKCSPLDGAVAFQRAIAHKYGWSQGVPTPGFFGDKPPVMIGVQVSATEKVNVPWGSINIPGIEGRLETGMKIDPMPCFVVAGKVKKKHAEDVRELIELTEMFLAKQSIYKGKAIKVSFAWMRDQERSYSPISDAPSYLDLKGITDDDLIFGAETIDAIRVGLFTPIEHADACRRNGVPLKRGILLFGQYGTGKTLTAYVAALKAERSGYTFIYLEDVRDLKRGLQLAAQYSPAVVFAEDIDRATSGERSVSIDEVLNTLDGVDTKSGEVITVLTTNHIEHINPAMLRPGRLDTLVEVLPPDAKAAERLVRHYGRDLLEEGCNLEKVGAALAGKIPALIREVTERAKIAAIARIGGGDIKGHVREEDLVAAANAMENHSRRLAARTEEPEAMKLHDAVIQLPRRVR